MSDDTAISIGVVSSDGVVSTVVAGELDMLTEHDLVDAVLLAMANHQGQQVVVDLTGVSFIDSSGLRALLRSRDAVTAEGRQFSLIVEEQGVVSRLLELAGVAAWFSYE